MKHFFVNLAVFEIRGAERGFKPSFSAEWEIFISMSFVGLQMIPCEKSNQISCLEIILNGGGP